MRRGRPKGHQPESNVRRAIGARAGRFPDRTVRRLLSLSCLTLLILFVAVCSDGTADEPSADEASALRLRAVLVRDRNLERDLSRAAKEIAAGRTVEAVRLLQAVLDRDEDGFLWRSDRPQTPQSARALAEEMLASLAEPGLRTYRDMSSAAATELLREADQAGDVVLYGEVARRFFHTPAGFTALDRLAARAMARHETGAALRLVRRTLAAPDHVAAMRPGHWRRALAAALARNDGEVAARARRALKASEPAAPADQNRSGARGPEDGGVPVSDQRPGARASEWPTILGDARRAGVSGVSLPRLRPVWSTSPFPMIEEKQPATVELQGRGLIEPFRQAAVEWMSERWTGTEPPGQTLQAIVVADRVIHRTVDGLAAVSLRDGSPAWSYRTPASPARPVSSEFTAWAPEAALPDVGGALAVNSVLGLLSSDGARVFAVQSPAFLGARPNQRATNGAADDPEKNLRNWNQLVALDVHAPAGRRLNDPLWTLGGHAANSAGDSLRLTGRFFFGPPLPHEGRLFVVAEHDRQVSVLCLRAADGVPLWSQALGYVDRAVDMDEFRMQQACLPTLVDGTLVCPTNLGYLVALDPDTGSLQWAGTCGEDWPDPRFGHAHLARTPVGSRCFPNVVVGGDGQVFTMTHHSHQIRAFDVRTGAVRWSVPRQDGEYLATVTDRHLVVVGRRVCRALARDTGAAAWKASLGMPVGTGLRLGAQYLVPLRSGRVAALDLATGRSVGFGFPLEAGGASAPSEENDDEDSDRASPPRLGNLVPAGDCVLSCGLTEFIAFRDAQTALADARRRLADAPADSATRLEIARLRLTLGDLDGGKDDLRAAGGPGVSDAAIRAEATRIRRDVLFSELADGDGDSERLLAELEPLCVDGESRSRFLTALLDRQSRTSDVAGLVETLRRFAAAPDAEEPVPMPTNPDHRIAPARRVAARLAELEPALSPDAAARIDALVASERSAALSSGSRDRLEAFLRVFGHRPEAEAVRLRLARLCLDAGRRQQAELLYNACRRSGDPAVRQAALAGLAVLNDRIGLFHLAARHMVELESMRRDGLGRDEPGRDADAGDETGSEAVDRTLSLVADDSPSRAFRAPYRPMVGPVRAVSIREDRLVAADMQLQKVFGPYRKKFLMPTDSGYYLVDRGIQPNTDSNGLDVIDRQTGALAGQWLAPRSMLIQSPQKPGLVGHFFPFGADGRAHGVSLIEAEGDGPSWSTPLKSTASQDAAVRIGSGDHGFTTWSRPLKSIPSPDDVIRPGPAGPGFASFQSLQYLAVLAPADGRILWERTDVDPESDQPDQYGSLHGDDQALVLFTGDRSSFAVYRTDTGEEIRRQRTDALGLFRGAFGRRLLFAPDGDSDKSLRLWDALTDRVVATVPVDERFYTAVTPGDDLVIVSRFRVVWIDGATGEVELNVELPQLDMLNVASVRAFSDGDALYLNLQREMRSPSTTQNVSPADMFLPAFTFNGDVVSIDRRTRAIRWKRALGSRSILDLSQHHLPFLVTAAHLRDRQNGNRSSLMIEVIDRETGATLGLNDNLVPSRLVLFDLDPQAGRIELTGLNSLIRLSFPRARQQPDRAPDARR